MTVFWISENTGGMNSEGMPKKKRSFFNRGRGINAEDFEMDSNTSPPPPGSSFSDSERSNSSESLAMHSHPSLSDIPEHHHHTSFNRAFIASAKYELEHPAYSPHMGYQALAPCSPGAFSGGTTTVPAAYFNQSHYNPLALGSAIGAPADLSSAYAADPYVSSCLTTRGFMPLSWPGSSGRGFRDENRREEFGTLQEGAPKKRQQKCSLCFNHGIIKEKKGHKWQCTFRNCDCPRCQITIGRQETMRKQQKLTRHLNKNPL